jgi:hypothetical protein
MLKMRKKTLNLTSIFFVMLGLSLHGCGGGSGGSTVSPTPTTGANTNFKSAPIELPNLVALTSDLCDSSGAYALTNIAYGDLNKDGRKDIVTQVFCFIRPGSTYSGPTKNTLITLLSQADGTFRLGNQELFGSARIDLGGTARKLKVFDINGDGYVDVAFAINKEDGRAVGSSTTSQDGLPTIMMSDSRGKYSIKTFGKADWLHHTEILATASGVDVFFAGFNNLGLQVYRFSGNTMIDVSDQYPSNLSAQSFIFLSESQILSDYIYKNANPGMAQVLLSKSTTGWSQTAEYSLPSTTVNFQTFQNLLLPAPLFDFAGRKVAGGAFPSQCLLKLSPSAAPIVLAQLNGVTVANYVPGTTINQSSLPEINYIAAFQTNANSVSLLDEVVQGQNTTKQWFQMRCADVNGDGYEDLVAETINDFGVPQVYLNNKAGKLVAFDTSLFPRNSASYAKSSLQDLDGDGIPDLIQLSSDNFSSTFRVYLGTKYLQ